MTHSTQQTNRKAQPVSILQPWRLLVSHDLPGPLNMALDEVLLGSVIGGGRPVLRFYTWGQATLSLGVNQPLGEIDRDACRARGVGVVRRLTGGRAVLHGARLHELTYSVAARANDERVGGVVLESYRKISGALVTGLGGLGVEVSLAEGGEQWAVGSGQEAGLVGPGQEAVCFAASSAYELTVGGKKLVGSAQARRGGALLQHGSILLDIDFEAWASVFAYATDAGKGGKEQAQTRLPTRMTSLRAVLGREVGAEEVEAALRPAFERALCVKLEAGSFTEAELAAAHNLAKSKYGSEEWTGRCKT